MPSVKQAAREMKRFWQCPVGSKTSVKGWETKLTNVPRSKGHDSLSRCLPRTFRRLATLPTIPHSFFIYLPHNLFLASCLRIGFSQNLGDDKLHLQNSSSQHHRLSWRNTAVRCAVGKGGRIR